MAKENKAKKEAIDKAELEASQKEMKEKVQAFYSDFAELQKKHGFTFKAVIRGYESNIAAEIVISKMPEQPEPVEEQPEAESTNESK